MEFCPKCGAILMMKKTKFGCPRCSYTVKGKVKMEMKEKIEKPEQISVIKKDSVRLLPVTEYKCEKCGNKKAYFWSQQTGEETDSESDFYKCTKCGNIVRED